MSSSPSLIGLVALVLPLAVRSALVRRGLTTNPSDLTSYTYDYVVVGGGTAGLAISALLSADSSVSVAVIEAGGLGQDVYDRVMIPALTYLEGVSVPGSPYDWGYFADGLNRTLHWPRGKILGGSSAINAEYAVRASKLEHDTWASLNPGASTDWSWSGLYPYMYATENYHPPSQSDITASDIKVDELHHNKNGPIHVSYPYYRYDQVNLWVPTLANLGVDTRDPSQGEGWGAYITPNTIDPSTATRSYSKTGYYDPASGRPNLAVLLGHQATRISFGAKGANGQPKPDYVEFAQAANGTHYQVKVNKEVIVCGGVIGTPQLLQLSGIGPKAVLDSFKIPTVVDLPGVGEHLQDHILAPVVRSTNASVTGDAAAVSDEVKAQQTALFKAGFFSETLFSAANNAIAYINLKQLMGNEGAAKFMQEVKANQSSILDFYNSTEASVKAGYKLTHDAEVNNILDSNVGVIELLMGNTGTFNPSAKTLAIQAAIQHPFARGNVVLNSTDPFVPPKITTNYLTNEADLIILREGVKYARKVGQTAPLNSILTEELQPGPDVVTDQDIDQYILRTAGTQYHPASTSSQLPRDKGGVVDTELKVYGVDGLRVIDSSIIPIGLCAHLVMPTYAIAEKGAGIMLNRAPPSANSSAPPKFLLSTNIIFIILSIIYFFVA